MHTRRVVRGETVSPGVGTRYRIDHKHVVGTASRLELEPQLLSYRREQLSRPLTRLVGQIAVVPASSAEGINDSPHALSAQRITRAGDLNADGDAVDAVLHVFDTKQRMAVNLRLAAASICRAIVGPPFTTCDPVSPVIGRTVVAFLLLNSRSGKPISMATATPRMMCSTSTTRRPAASSTPDSL